VQLHWRLEIGSFLFRKLHHSTLLLSIFAKIAQLPQNRCAAGYDMI